MAKGGILVFIFCTLFIFKKRYQFHFQDMYIFYASYNSTDIARIAVMLRCKTSAAFALQVNYFVVNQTQLEWSIFWMMFSLLVVTSQFTFIIKVHFEGNNYPCNSRFLWLTLFTTYLRQLKSSLYFTFLFLSSMKWYNSTVVMKQHYMMHHI